MHPFVYFHEYRLCDAGVPGLTRADGSEVHGTIESELDELVLFEKRGETIATFNPSAEILNASNFTLHVISKMYAYVALTALYGEIVPADLFETAVKDFRVAQRVFYSPSGRKRALFGRVEELLRPLVLQVDEPPPRRAYRESQFDNRAREAWENPFTGDMSTASFWDLFDEALGKAQDNLFAFDEDGFDLAAARHHQRARLRANLLWRSWCRSRRRCRRAAAARRRSVSAPCWTSPSPSPSGWSLPLR